MSFKFQLIKKMENDFIFEFVTNQLNMCNRLRDFTPMGVVLMMLI